MSSYIASLVVRRALCRSLLPACWPRSYSAFPRFLITPWTVAKPLPAISARLASSSAAAKSLSPDDKIKKADESLLRVLDAEIACAEDSEDAPSEVSLPDDSPFEIIDSPGEQSVILKREYQGETIQIRVFLKFEFDEEDTKEENNDDSEDGDVPDQNISLVVTIKKGDGPNLEFCCNLDKGAVHIESLAMKSSEGIDDEAYEGPDFSDLDEKLQRAFRKYLSARGISGSLYEFLHEYMMSKDEKEYISWLKNLKEFVAK